MSSRNTRLSSKWAPFAACWAFAVAVWCGSAPARPPEPDPVPRRWQMEVQPGPLRFATIDVPGKSERSYFYMTYKVTNASGNDLLLAPAFDLANDRGVVVRSGRDVPAEVTRALLAQLDNPFLEDQIGILGILQQGPENAKEGLVVWPAQDIKGEEVAVYASGFSGESRNVESPDPRTGEMKRYNLRKTLMLRYRIPGEIYERGSEPLELVERRWILR
ncbi:MAG: hypothetical protein IT436_12985 [Phycisphaerales bacterium]|nr:hypothetical protein [Phycisphaerales bacterium]